VGLIFLSYWSNVAAIALLKEGSSSLIEDILNVNVQRLTSPEGAAITLLPYFLLQYILGTVFTVSRKLIFKLFINKLFNFSTFISGPNINSLKEYFRAVFLCHC
jgi:E3 ubiquitin-protein ligase RNF139